MLDYAVDGSNAWMEIVSRKYARHDVPTAATKVQTDNVVAFANAFIALDASGVAHVVVDSIEALSRLCISPKHRIEDKRSRRAAELHNAMLNAFIGYAKDIARAVGATGGVLVGLFNAIEASEFDVDANAFAPSPTIVEKTVTYLCPIAPPRMYLDSLHGDVSRADLRDGVTRSFYKIE